MHSIYAYVQSNNDNIQVQEKFLMNSIEKIYDLYILQLLLLVELLKKAEHHSELIKKKHLATLEDKNPNDKFIKNEIINLLIDSSSLSINKERLHLNNWSSENDNEYVNLLFQEMIESDLYKEYMSTRTSSFNEDKQFVEDLFKKIIAPNEKLYNYYEDKKLTWINDYPLVNTSVLKTIRGLKKTTDVFILPDMYRDEEEDTQFAKDLFRKTLKYYPELQEEIEGKTPNWDSERITLIDAILLRMAICELLYFSSIPVKVTINEYLEIAKEYATPKSSSFINGILDNIVKDYKSTNRLNKSGRGLM